MSAGDVGRGPRDGLLLVNVGTPRSPRTGDVRRYLREFLMDPRVLDLPAWRRFVLVYGVIVPRRARRSARAYRRIWSERGSPLLVHGGALQAKVQERLRGEYVVELGMRYGDPSIAAAMAELERHGAERIVVMPLYAQHSGAATSSSLEAAYAVAASRPRVPRLEVVGPFFDHPAYLDARAAGLRPTLERLRPELVLFSFHGLPVRQIRRSDPAGRCLVVADCCARLEAQNRHCYRAQCCAAARLLADRLGIPEARRRVAFQSRLGRSPWLGPSTDEVLRSEAARARRGLVVPGFVLDCLETLEELGLAGVETWRRSGGETLEVAPCLNADDAWADAVTELVRERERTAHGTAPRLRAAASPGGVA